MFINTLKLFESLRYLKKTKTEVLQDLELEADKEKAFLEALKLEGKEMNAEAIE